MSADRLRGRCALITGSNGTVGTPLVRALRAQGATAIGWDRAKASPLDDAAVRAHVAEVRPDVVFHLATASSPTGADNESWRVNVAWTETLLQAARDVGARFVFTSTAMVFSNAARGPFSVESRPDATEGYGFEKRTCESRIVAGDSRAVVARLGWQIGETPGSNNMIDHLVTRMRDEGCVRASTRWLPACSFLADTVDALLQLANEPGGLYQLDANDRWSFYDIARALAARHRDRGWIVEPTDDFVYDQRLREFRIQLPALAARLPELLHAAD